MKELHRRITAAFIAVYLIWGSTYLAIRFGVETIPPFLMAGVRSLTAGLMLYAWRRLRGAPRPALTHWKSAAVVGGLLLLGGNGLVSWAEKQVPSGAAALMVATVPLWMALLQVVRDRSFRPAPAAWAGILVGFAGVGFLSGVGSAVSLNLAAVGALVMASVSWAVGSLYSRRAPLPADTLLAVGMEMLCGGALLVAAGLLIGEGGGFSLAGVSLRSGLALGYLISAGSIVGFTCYVWLLRVASPVAVSSYAYVNPVVAVALGWALAGEAFTPRMLVGAGAIVAGVVLMTAAPRGTGPAVES